MRGTPLPPKSILRPGLFDPDNLADDGLENALSECNSILTDKNIESVVEDLFSKPSLIEFVISAMGEGSPLCRWILDQFPNNAAAFASSLSTRLLSRISLSLIFLDHAFSKEALEAVKKCSRSVELALKVLQVLSSMSFAEGEADMVTAADDEDEDVTIVVKAKNKSQRKKKQAKRFGLITVDAKLFQNIGVPVPNTPEEARELSRTILRDQKDSLEFCLETLCSAEVSETVKRVYLYRDNQADSDARPQDNSDRISVVEDVSTEDNPAAYPMVQPMKAALYFDSAEGFGEWRILISTRADRHLRVARKTDAKVFRIIIKKIKELSNGHFSDDNQKRLNGPNTTIPIYEAKMTRDSRLVYQVDCLPEYDSDVERQVLKIFGIYTHAQLDGRFWDSMSCQLSRKGKEYHSRCTFRNKPLLNGDNVVLPASFPPQTESDRPDLSANVPELPHQDLEEIHSLLVLEKFVTFSQALLNSIIADQDVAHVFDVTSQEKEIIEHTCSCYVLGRSGTGKTTTMLFKMLGIERAWDLRRGNMPKPRQIFVTQSRVLAGKVEEYFTKLLASLETAARTPKELIELVKMKKSRQEEDDLIDLDDEADWRSDLPRSFSLLRDEHFPLFITFDRLCKLLESDIENGIHATGDPSSPQECTSATFRGAVVPSKHRQNVGSLVSYSVFLECYWPHFSQPLTKGLDPSLVFSEFIGVIKGSGGALGHGYCYLDQEAYESLSYRSQATFATQRNIIYRIFQSYIKRKRERGDYDAADRTHSILKNLQTCGVPGQKIDYLYVDEVQDNLLIDTFLLRLLCRNPDGLFWAGDTAQTISVGSSFRFDDLKAFLFRIELSRRQQNAVIPRPMEPPRTFQLAINYRSHGGIVNCAHSVIELITKFWPYSIDILAQEKGVVDGSKPVFFSGWDQDTVRYEQFLFGQTGNHIEFGAQQCILVRDDAARDKLREQVGNIGLIMTLYESKGLEFSDVLLYNFFQDSTADLSQWRVVLNALEDGQHYAAPAPRFDETRHAGVCSELKFLYVAITRARKNMWIVDCSERGNPMRVFWTGRNQIQNCTPGTDVPKLAVSSTPQEWAMTGKTLFQNKRYLQAMHCFERASMHREVAVAEAYYLRQQARTSMGQRRYGHMQTRASSFLSAGEAFLECAKVAKKERRVYFRNAADCFEHGGNEPRAAQAYLDGEEFDLAAKLYRKLGMFDEAVRVVKSHKGMMQAHIVEGITDVARLFYFKEHDLQKANALFESYEDELEYLEDRSLDVARATLLISLDRKVDAAEIYLAEGRTLEAITLFLQDQGNVVSMRRGNECILQGLWENLSFGVTRDSAHSNPDLRQLLSLATQLNTALLDPCAHDEILMFQAIMSGESARLQELGEKFSLIHNIVPAAMLCLDHWSVNPPRIQVLKGYDVAIILRAFLDYTRLLHNIAFDPDPCNNPSIRKLFGFRRLAENSFQILPDTFLHRAITDTQISALQPDNKVSGLDLTRIFRQSLQDRLRRRVSEENEMCRNAQAFSPCLTFTIYGYCNRVECPNEHITVGELDAIWYNVRVRLHLQQILICQSLHSIEPRVEQLSRQIYWIGKLYDAFNPPFYNFGTFANLSLALIPEAQRGLQVVKDWVRNLLDNLHLAPYILQTSLTTAIRTASLAFSFDQKQAIEYVYRAPFVSVHRPPAFLRGKEAAYIVGELVASLQGAEVWSLSGGILSIRHIISQKLGIEIGVLCNVIDYICGSLVLSARCRGAAVLHNVTLPRSWLLTLSQHGGASRDTRYLWMIVQPLRELLEQLCLGGSDAEHLLFEHINLSKLTTIRNVFIARICRSLCLLGYNVNDSSLRHNILQAITSLQRIDPSRRFPRLCSRYITAQRWEHLVHEVRQSTTGSTMDELILVFHPSRVTASPYAPPGTRSVVISTLQELPHVLDRSSITPNIPTLRPNAIPFVPSGNFEIKEDDRGVIEEESLEGVNMTNEAAGIEDGEVEEVDLHPMDTENIISADIPQSWQPVTAPTAEEINAARIIQAVYSRATRRGRGIAKAVLPAARSRHFAAFYSEARELHWPHKYYRLLFLGPLPHILLCLEFSSTYAWALKEKAKRRLSDSKHQELEELGERMTLTGGILKDIKRLRKALEPKADVHRRRDVEELKALVKEVEVLVNRLPSGSPYDLQHDLQLGIKGIVKSNQPRKTRQRPDLVIEDNLSAELM